jgi:hypothetical protein
MPEGDNPEKQEAARKAEYARMMAEAVRRHVQAEIPTATEREYMLGSLEVGVTFYYRSDSKSAIEIEYDDEHAITYNITPAGVLKTGSVDPRYTTGKPVTYWEYSQTEIALHNWYGRHVLPAPEASSVEQALLSRLAHHPFREGILAPLAERAMWNGDY